MKRESKGQTTKKRGETSSNEEREQAADNPKIVLRPGASVKVIEGQHRILAVERVRELAASILEHAITVPIRVSHKRVRLSDKRK